MSWKVGFVTSENILLVHALVHIWWPVEKTEFPRHEMWQASFTLVVLALRKICHKGSQSIGAFVVSTFVVLLVLEKFYSNSICLVSQNSFSVTGHLTFLWETGHTISTTPSLPLVTMKAFVSEAKPGGELSGSCEGDVLCTVLWGCPLNPGLSCKKAYWPQSLLRLTDPRCQWPDDGSFQLKKTSIFEKKTWELSSWTIVLLISMGRPSWKVDTKEYDG